MWDAIRETHRTPLSATPAKERINNSQLKILNHKGDTPPGEVLQLIALVFARLAD